jgi:hypothetical protein
MDALWRRSPLTIEAIAEAVAAQAWGMATVKTLISSNRGKCGEDTWIELVKGSMEPRWCATRQGVKSCKWVG